MVIETVAPIASVVPGSARGSKSWLRGARRFSAKVLSPFGAKSVSIGSLMYLVPKVLKDGGEGHGAALTEAAL
jgi:hypothetical protein